MRNESYTFYRYVSRYTPVQRKITQWMGFKSYRIGTRQDTEERILPKKDVTTTERKLKVIKEVYNEQNDLLFLRNESNESDITNIQNRIINSRAMIRKKEKEIKDDTILVRRVNGNSRDFFKR